MLTPDVLSLPHGLARRIASTIEAFPDKVLLRDEQACLSGSGIASFIRETGAFVSELCTGRGRVAVLMPNSAVLAATILAVLSLGRVPVVLQPYPRRAHVEDALARLKPDLVIASRSVYPDLDAPCSLLQLDLAGGSSFQERPRRLPPRPPPPAGVALILYTSGSEGEPKGVQLSQAGILYTIDYLIDRFHLGATSISTCLLPLWHTMGLNTQFLPSFFAGGESVLFDVSMSLGSVYRNILSSRGSFVGLVPEFLQWCHEEMERRGLGPALGVRQVQIAGGPIREGHLRQARALFPGAEIHRGYGLTEAIRVTQISSADPAFFGDTEGYVLPGQQVEIRDAKGESLPRGSAGRIWVRGPNVMLGYDDDAANRVDSGFLDTGDMGSLSPENRLTLFGRRDSLFKIRGERVSGREIEAAAVASMPCLRDVRCLPVASAGRMRSILFVELAPGAGTLLDTEPLPDIRSGLLERLHSKLKMPDSVCFVERFPRTHNGKVCLKTLKDWFTAGGTEVIGRQKELRVARCQGPQKKPDAAEGNHALDND